MVAESDDLALRNQKCQLIFTCIVELAELHSAHFRAGRGSEMLQLGAFDEQVLEGWVRIFSVLDVCKFLPGGVLFTVVPGRKVVRILDENQLE